MNDKIKWKNYLWSEEKRATLAQVRNVEKILDIKFPKSYLETATINQGKRPEPNRVRVGEGSSGMTTFLLFEDNPKSADSSYGIIHSHKVFKDEDYSPLIIPFGQAGGACLFCFDYRKIKDNPLVVFIDWDSFGNGDEEAIIPVAKNFTEFLEMFYEDKE